MDYRKIGQVLERNGAPPRPPRAILGGGELRECPLDELGLAGLIERLALAIRRATASD